MKDLCARLPYSVVVEHTSGFRGTLHDIVIHHIYDDNDNVYDAICYTDFFGDEDHIHIEYFKPYLFPLESMTEKQKNYIHINPHGICVSIFDNKVIDASIEGYDWLNKNHFDYRGLIEKGLAIDATDKNIY